MHGNNNGVPNANPNTNANNIQQNQNMNMNYTTNNANINAYSNMNHVQNNNFPQGQSQMNPNVNYNTSTFANFSETAKKYDEKIKKIMLSLSNVSNEDPDILRDAQKKIEDEIIDFERIMDEECMNRVVATHRMNMGLIGKLRELKYDFTEDKNKINYDAIIGQTISSLKNLNNNQ